MHVTRTLLASWVLLAAATARGEDAPPAQAPAEAGLPEPVPLAEATASGRVAARGEDPRSYRGITLLLHNPGAEPVAVDVCGAALAPATPRSCQRLGIGPPREPTAVRPDTPGVVIDLKPGEERRIDLRTCCLDVRLPAPSGQRFVVSKAAPRPETTQVLRWWAEHPDAPQGAVNAAIWAGRTRVAWTPGTPSDRWPREAGIGGNRVAARSGVVYQVKDGDVSSLDPDGTHRLLGAGILHVLPTDDAIYGVAPEGGDGVLLRLTLTGDDTEPWATIARLGEDRDLLQVLPLGPGRLLLLSRESARRLDLGTGTLETVATNQGYAPTSLHADDRGRLTLVTSRTRRGSGVLPVLSALSTETGVAFQEEEYWDLRYALAGPAGVFGLTHAGRLMRFSGRKPLAVGEARDLESLIGVGRRRIWGVARDGGLVGVDAASGRVAARPSTPFDPTWTAYSVDAVTGDLVTATSAGWTRCPGDGSPVVVLPAPP